jgi:colicin import membrane protein
MTRRDGLPHLTPCAWLVLAGFCTTGLAAGAGVDDEASRLAAGRRAIEATYERRLVECQGRFAVTACIDSAREDRRRSLAPLRERELALDLRDRAGRAEQRRQAVAGKQQALAARPLNEREAPSPSPPPPQTLVPSVRDTLPAPNSSLPTDLQIRTRDHTETTAPREREAAVRVQKRREREAKAQAERERVAERQMERSLRGKPVQPLPLPAASAPGR